MPILIVETLINASPEVCFDLVRKIASDDDKSRQTANGEFALGQTVTFINSFLGVEQKLTVKVTEFERPSRFTDEMTQGVFKYFKHIHEFISRDNDTLLKDTFVWTMPLGVLGKIADRLFLENHLRNLVQRRNARLKQAAEDSQI